MRLLLLSVFTLIVYTSQSQNQYGNSEDTIFTDKSFSISYNIIQSFINEHEISVEYRLTKKTGLGITIGKIFYNDEFDPLFLSPSQSDYPGTVYTGFSLRPYYNFYYSQKRKHNYLYVQLLFKKMSYENRTFQDDYDGEHDYAIYTRSENARVFGVDLMQGHQYKFTTYKIIFFEFFYGIGIRYRSRDYNTLDGRSFSVSLCGCQLRLDT